MYVDQGHRRGLVSYELQKPEPQNTAGEGSVPTAEGGLLRASELTGT
jgi:hypothetical protein